MKIFSQINNSGNGLLLICFSKIGFSSNLCPKDQVGNRPLPELLIWEKIFIYKNKEVAINFETPQFSDLYKLMDADGGRPV